MHFTDVAYSCLPAQALAALTIPSFAVMAGMDAWVLSKLEKKINGDPDIATKVWIRRKIVKTQDEKDQNLSHLIFSVCTIIPIAGPFISHAVSKKLIGRYSTLGPLPCSHH